ncbi:protein SPMIP1-like [Onthophagus taurus]|uniref:protein SPMIP1-like n=1 Tax=Onthophagus taurus TaxID=166361 RepID=UPI0039BE9130
MAGRGLEIHKEFALKGAVEKEDRLRLAWFRKNEEKLTESANAPLQRQVPAELKEDLRNHRREYHNNKEFRPKVHIGDPDPPLVDPNAFYHVMKPIDPAVVKLLYGSGRYNRIAYLKERVKTIPDKRFYLPETTNFTYGWNMWECAKDKPNYGFGRCQVIRDSFYRRFNVGKDPDWYTYPAKLSPTVCN